MRTSAQLTLLILLVAVISGCQHQRSETETVEHTETTTTKPEAKINISGNYVSDGYAKRNEKYDWVAVSVQAIGADKIKVAVRSRVDLKKPTCTFDATAFKRSDSVYTTVIEGKTVLFKFEKNALVIAPENATDEGTLFYYCSGGATVAGRYERLNEPLDESQMDKTVFNKNLRLQGIGFNVQTKKQDAGETLTVEPYGLSVDNQPVTISVPGKVTDAEIEDLNSDGYPEVLIYTQTGANNQGNVIGFSVNKGKSMSQISFPEVAQNPRLNKGYAGQDEFSVVETSLVQRFPLMENGQPTGKVRQVQYKLEDGEASRKLVVKNATEISKPAN